MDKGSPSGKKCVGSGKAGSAGNGASRLGVTLPRVWNCIHPDREA